MMKMRTLVMATMAATVIGSTAAKADLKIGVAGPMTGSEAAFGEQFRRGAEKAVADINAKGGVLGQKIELVIGDDACDPKQAVNVANDFVSKGVVFVAGHYCSGSSIPASDVYAEANIVQMTPASSNPKFTERGLANVFRLCGRDDAQGPTAAKYVMAHFKGKNVAIIDDKSAYGKGLADEFQKAYDGMGAKEVLRDSITAGEKDYSPLVAKLKDLKADVLYCGCYKTEAGLIVRQMRDQGVKTQLVSGDAVVSEEFWAITGPAGEGTLITFGPDARLDPANADLVKYFRSQNYEPEAYTLYTYATIQAWAEAAQKAGSTDAAKVEAALHGNKFKTVMGDISFDAKGDVAGGGYVFYVWHDGKYTYAK